MLDWLDAAGPDLENLEPDYFDWNLERETDASKSIITWRALKSSNPHQKCVKRVDENAICECSIRADHFLSKYVKPALDKL